MTDYLWAKFRVEELKDDQTALMQLHSYWKIGIIF